MIRPTRSLALTAMLTIGAPCLALAAGDVLVTVQRGSLKITGDSVANAIHVVPGGDTGTYDVESLDGTTTVNGSLATFHAVGVVRNMKIDMQEGDDAVVLEDADLGEDIEIATGSGGDLVEIDDTHILGNTRIATGVGDDEVVLGTSSFGGSVIVQTDSGNDGVSFDLATASDRVKVATGSGADVVSFSGGSHFSDVVTVTTSNGADTLTTDDVVFAADVDAVLGEDNDDVSMAATTAARHLSLNGGSEIDTLTLGGGNGFAFGLELVKFESVL